MFSKAKRFDCAENSKNPSNKVDQESQKIKTKLLPPVAPITSKVLLKSKPLSTPRKPLSDTHSQCSSTTSTKSIVTPKSIKPTKTKVPISLKKEKITTGPAKSTKLSTNSTWVVSDDIVKAQAVEIRNKDVTIAEHNKQIEELKNEILLLNNQLTEISGKKDVEIRKQLSKLTLSETDVANEQIQATRFENIINKLNVKVSDLENQCTQLEQEVSSKQIELMSMEELITIRDSLCTDLQEKLNKVEACLEETKQRLEMVKGHHALALEANESIRKEYKAELEALKLKFEEEKQNIIAKFKTDQDNIKSNYKTIIDSIKNELSKERDEIYELQQQLITKDQEMKAKLEQIDEATHEKIRICEIQFEERSRTIHEHWAQQQKQIQCLEKERKELKYSLEVNEKQNFQLKDEINFLKKEIDFLKAEKCSLNSEVDDVKEDFKKKRIEFENEINKLTVEVDKAIKDKNKFEMSLLVTRDIVNVLTMRLRESDNELEHLENKVHTLTNSKELLEDELNSYKNTLENTIQECSEYKQALVNILKSKAALAKEHTRIMEHNVTLIESLQNVEKEAYRELGSIKHELIEDVELIKKESNSQIQMLREEVEKKRVLCELAKEHAGQATAAAEQSRALVVQAANEITRLETENQHLQQQIQDQQSLVVELSLLRQENEELTMAMAKQSSMIDKMKKDAEQAQSKPKSPSVIRKAHKAGKENLQVVVSPLRERNY